MNLLEGKTIIVTGGGYGIGREIALACAAEGASVVIAARNREALEKTRSDIERLGAQSVAITTDVAREEDCEAMVQRTVATFGRLDGLVNNAGISGPSKRITEMTLAEWQEVIDVNLTGAWLASRAALRVMERQRAGTILNIGSISGRRGFAFRTPYTASKWGMVGLTQTLALEWGRLGIRVNCICPGAVEGDRINRVIHARAQALGIDPERVHEDMVKMAPLHRMVTGTEVARTAIFLLSDLASGITGQSVNVDAGAAMN